MLELTVILALAVASPAPGCAYSAELPLYRLCEASAWRTLRPLISKADDVRAALGTPTAEHDLASYLAPYPGDDRAQAPVLTFDDGADWEILVYFVGTVASAREQYPKSLHDRVFSIDLVPRHRIPFSHVRFPAAFVKSHVIAADAAWDEYRHPSGLVYEVYASRTPYSHTVPGDLNRISYGVSDEAKKAYGGDRSNHGFQPTVGAPSTRASCSTRTLRAAGG